MRNSEPLKHCHSMPSACVDGFFDHTGAKDAASDAVQCEVSSLSIRRLADDGFQVCPIRLRDGLDWCGLATGSRMLPRTSASTKLDRTYSAGSPLFAE